MAISATRFGRRASVHFWFIFPVFCATVGSGWNLAQTFPVKYIEKQINWHLITVSWPVLKPAEQYL